MLISNEKTNNYIRRSDVVIFVSISYRSSIQTVDFKPSTFLCANTGSASDPFVIKKLNVAPDPIVLGRNITVAAGEFDTHRHGKNFSSFFCRHAVVG
jgi:hypothetical protein